MNQIRTVAVAAEDERGLDAQVASHFGRCPAYVLVEASGREVRGARVVRNPHYESHEPGQVPDFVRELGAEAVVAGGMGRRAVDLFSELGIDVAAGVTGSVRDAVGAYLRGNVKGVVACTHGGHRGCGGGRHESHR